MTITDLDAFRPFASLSEDELSHLEALVSIDLDAVATEPDAPDEEIQRLRAGESLNALLKHERSVRAIAPTPPPTLESRTVTVTLLRVGAYALAEAADVGLDNHFTSGGEVCPDIDFAAGEGALAAVRSVLASEVYDEVLPDGTRIRSTFMAPRQPGEEPFLVEELTPIIVALSGSRVTEVTGIPEGAEVEVRQFHADHRERNAEGDYDVEFSYRAHGRPA